METLLATLTEQVRAYSSPELVAVLFAFLYLVLAIRQSIWCWLCAMISTAIYVWIFIVARLYMDSALNVFYFIMAIYGWLVWRSGARNDDGLPVSVWPAKIHFTAIFAITISSASCGFLLARYSDAAYPYIDSATTFAAIWATFLVARKVLENWWYWLVIDSVSVAIYWSRDLELTALLFVVYVALIPLGLVSWTHTYRNRPNPVAHAA